MQGQIIVENLAKSYVRRKKGLQYLFQKKEQIPAVKNVSFTIEPGEIFGLLGPNGAGKTTTIKMLSTLLEPTAGRAIINGYDLAERPAKVRETLGTVLTGERSIYWKLTGRENLIYFGTLYGLSRQKAKEGAQQLLDRLELTDRADELVESYSSGMKQRIALGKALIFDPPILLLDEPTVGLDPQSAHKVRELIEEIRDEGRTILLTTHYMQEADRLCDRVAIIDNGEIIALDCPQVLKNKLEEKKLVNLTVNEWRPEIEDSIKGLEPITNIVSNFKEQEGIWELGAHLRNGQKEALPSLLDVLYRNGVQVQSFEVVDPTLEDVFIHLTGKSLRE